MTVAFNAAYAVSLLLAGRLMDVLGLRWGFTIACAFWGLAAMSHSLVSTAAGFFAVRILLGLGEGGNFPAAIKTIAEWFPKRERALATGLFNSGSNVGGILVPFGLPFVIATFSSLAIFGSTNGWRGAFLITGLVDLGWIIAWLLDLQKTAGTSAGLTRRAGPDQQRSAGTGGENPVAPAVAPSPDLGLCHRQVHDRLFLVVLSVWRAASSFPTGSD